MRLSVMTCLVVVCLPLAATAGPICATSSIIAVPTGLGVTSPADADNDGLVDKAEDEIAACFIPEYHFDSLENARWDFEPVMLHSVSPLAMSGAGELRIQIRFAELYQSDGGFVHCDWVADGCNSHIGDSQGQTISVVVRSLRSVELEEFATKQAQPAFNGTHPIVYPSAGKHHTYTSVYTCPGEDMDACEFDSLLLPLPFQGTPLPIDIGWYDRANGAGAVVKPTSSRNAGEASFFNANTQQVTTPPGFINGLGQIHPFYANEAVFDLCNNGEECSGTAPLWSSFFGGDSEVSSLYEVIFSEAPSPTPIFLRQPGGVCSFGSSLPDNDSDADGIPNDCDPCAAARRGLPNGKDTVTGLSASLTELVLADSDGDGRTNGCDLCPGKSDGWRGNANEDGEADLGVTRRGDACDPHAASAIHATRVPTVSEPFEDDTLQLQLWNAQAPAAPPPTTYDGDITVRRCFCVDNAGNKIDDLSLCSNPNGGLSVACPRNGVASASFKEGLGWLPFRVLKRNAAGDVETCQPWAAFGLSPAISCKIDGIMAPMKATSPGPGPMSTSDWRKQPNVTWMLWDETKQVVIEDACKLAARTPRLPLAVRQARQPLWFEQPTIGFADACQAAKSPFVSKCSCQGLECLVIQGDQIGGQTCVDDAVPYHADGDVAFWTQVAPDNLTWGNHALLHNAFTTPQRIVTADSRGGTSGGKSIPEYSPGFWWLHPAEPYWNPWENLAASPEDVVGGTPALLAGFANSPVLYSATFDAASSEYDRYGDLGPALMALAGARQTPSDFSGFAMAPVDVEHDGQGRALPVWLAWHAATGRLGYLVPDGVVRNLSGGIWQRGQAVGATRYVLATSRSLGLTGVSGKLARLDDAEFLLAIEGGREVEFHAVTLAGAARRLELPEGFEHLTHVSSAAGSVIVMGDSGGDTLLAVVTPDGEVDARRLANLTVDPGVKGRASDGAVLFSAFDAAAGRTRLYALASPGLEPVALSVAAPALGSHALVTGQRLGASATLQGFPQTLDATGAVIGGFVLSAEISFAP